MNREYPDSSMETYRKLFPKLDSPKGCPICDHPCQIPVSMMERILKLIDAKCVCDPFMGVGTTGVAAKNLGIDFIGIEKDPHYFEQAKERLEV